MKNRIVKRLTALAAAFALCVGVTGCQGSSGESFHANNESSTQQEQQTGASTAGENGDVLSMGRYVEKQLDLGGYVEGHSCMRKDGEQLWILPYGNTLYTSEDNGESWSGTALEWYTKLEENNYIMESAFSNDGTFAVQYSPLSEREQAVKDGTSDETQADLNNSEEVQNTPLDAHLMVITPDGVQQEVPVAFSADEMYARALHFTQDGRLFVVTYGKGVYEIDVQTGALNRLCAIESSAMYLDTQDQLLLLPTYDGLFIYDMESERFIEDETLDSFVKETYGEPTDFGSCYNMYAFFGEENVIYIAGEKGLHRHVIGGSAVEQVIDPSLSSFGNPSREIVHAMELENQEFLAQFTDGSLIKFYYDATVPTVPNEKLVVYSLKNNDTVRQAIAGYQTANPGMYVEYEVALDGEGITREDALKNLSTRLLNGEGPDVLILDNMPMDTYVEKGVLLDLSSVLDQVKSSNELYENLLVPFMQDGSIYAVPIEFQLPLVMGEGEYVERSKDYKGYAQSIVELRAAYPEGKIISDCNETGITMRFIPTCAPAWKNEDGRINEERIREFLELTKTIYDAQMLGVSQKQISDYNDMSVFKSGANDGSDGQIDWGFYFKMIDNGSFIQEGAKMASGNVYSMNKLSEALSMPKNKGCENLDVGLFDGQSRSVYMPQTMTGINAQSKNVGAAEAFVGMMLSEELQTSTFLGLPINKGAFEILLAEHDDTWEDGDGGYMMYGGSDNEGNSWFWSTWWFDEEQKQLIRDWAAQAKTPYIEDSMLEDAVKNACVEYLKGKLGLDAAVAQIADSTAIYMSE